jgi:hypothetical protein
MCDFERHAIGSPMRACASSPCPSPGEGQRKMERGTREGRTALAAAAAAFGPSSPQSSPLFLALLSTARARDQREILGGRCAAMSMWTLSCPSSRWRRSSGARGEAGAARRGPAALSFFGSKGVSSLLSPSAVAKLTLLVGGLDHEHAAGRRGRQARARGDALARERLHSEVGAGVCCVWGGALSLSLARSLCARASLLASWAGWDIRRRLGGTAPRVSEIRFGWCEGHLEKGWSPFKNTRRGGGLAEDRWLSSPPPPAHAQASITHPYALRQHNHSSTSVLAHRSP